MCRWRCALSGEDAVQTVARWRSCWYDQPNLAAMLGVPLSSFRDHPRRLGGRGLGRSAKTRLQK